MLLFILKILALVYLIPALVITVIVGGINWAEAKRNGWHDLTLTAAFKDSVAVGLAWPGLAVMLLGYVCLGKAAQDSED